MMHSSRRSSSSHRSLVLGGRQVCIMMSAQEVLGQTVLSAGHAALLWR